MIAIASAAPQGLNSIAQGNALGIQVFWLVPALKGPNRLLRPFRADTVFLIRNPGRCPGLFYFAPSAQLANGH